MKAVNLLVCSLEKKSFFKDQKPIKASYKRCKLFGQSRPLIATVVTFVSLEKNATLKNDGM